MKRHLIALAVAAAGLSAPAPAPAAAQDTDYEAMYSHVEEYWLQHREARLAAERGMDAPLWIGDLGDGEAPFVVEEAEYRRVLLLLRDWSNSSDYETDKVDLLPALDRHLFETLGKATIGFMDEDQLDLHVAALRANRGRALDRYAAVLALAAERFQRARDTRVSAEQPDLYRVYDTTYGELHFEAGWYGDESKTIAVHDVYEDPDRGGWVVEGRWGRASNPDHDGGFSFVFGGPCRFAGSWWYGEADENTVGTAWSGECQ